MSNFNPTTNRITLGLLSEDEQTELLFWPHGWELYRGTYKIWEEIEDPIWNEYAVYRGKPAPPVVVTTWTPIYENGCTGFAYGSLNEARVGVAGVGMVGIMRLDITDGVPKATIIGRNYYANNS